MASYRLGWALVCVAATLSLPAFAGPGNRSAVIRPGDSLDTLAKKFDCSKYDIARANGLKDTEAILVDGQRLVIPPAAPRVLMRASMKKPVSLKADRVGIRRGPGTGYRRVALRDFGYPMIATHRVGEWLQVRMPNGDSGWVRSDMLDLGDVTARRRYSQVREEFIDSQRPDPEPRRRISSSSSHRRTASRSHRTRHRYARRSHWSEPEIAEPRAAGDIVRTAFAYRGAPYRYGGSSRRGFDCSGFTSKVFAKEGVSLPHNSAEQFGYGRRVKSGDMKPGDLVFFRNGRRGIGHVGIYAGDGKFVHANRPGGHVKVDSLRSGYYERNFRGARRVK